LVPFPINKAPFTGVVVSPVPPYATPRAFVRFNVPMVTVPPVAMLIAVVAPLLPTLNRMLSVVPTPEVDCRVREDDAAVPPIISGEVTDVAKDGVADVEIVTAPVAPDTLIFVPATAEVTPVFVTVTAPVAPETLMPVPATLDVTPVLAIEIEPAPLVTLMAVPAVNVVRVKPVPLPISSAPLAGVVVKPVPPFATASVPATVIAPVDAVEGVNPVVPKVMDVTAAVEGTAPHDGAPLVVATRT